jgi:membrane protease YdiL (CAAX protease family)
MMKAKTSRFEWGEAAEPLAMGALLVTYSNGLAVWAESHRRFPEALFRRLNPLLIAAMLVYASRRPGGIGGTGLRASGLARSLGEGITSGIGLSILPLLFFRRPVLLDTPLEYGPVAKMTRRELLEDVFLRMPVGIALFEELAFRGLLYTAIRRSYSVQASVLWSAAAFAAWHLAVTYTSALQTNIADTLRVPESARPIVKPLVVPAAVAGGMLTTGVAGIIFALLRERTRNLSGPILAHWIVDALMIAALWARSNAVRPTEPLTEEEEERFDMGVEAMAEALTS